jgi:hypothetical protein
MFGATGAARSSQEQAAAREYEHTTVVKVIVN